MTTASISFENITDAETRQRLADLVYRDVDLTPDGSMEPADATIQPEIGIGILYYCGPPPQFLRRQKNENNRNNKTI